MKRNQFIGGGGVYELQFETVKEPVKSKQTEKERDEYAENDGSDSDVDSSNTDYDSNSEDSVIIDEETQDKRKKINKTRNEKYKKNRKSSGSNSSNSSKSESPSTKKKRSSSNRSNSNNKKRKHIVVEKRKKTTTKEKTTTIDIADSDDDEKHKDKQKEKSSSTDIYISKASFYSRNSNSNPFPSNIEGLKKALSEIYFQDEGKEEVIYKIYAQAFTPYRSKLPRERICSLHITGGSGIGKSDTAKLIAKFLNVGQDTEYPNQFIELSLSKYSDQSHAVGITGAAAGLIGHNNTDLVLRLKESEKQVIEGEDNPFVVLLLDEVCKGHPAFMNSFNPLLSDGRIANVKEDVYIIPNGTLLIIFWTSNFAENIKNPHVDPEGSIRYVYDLMLSKGFDNCDIARIGGDPIIYNPLSRDNMYEIIEKTGNNRIALHPFSIKYGIPVYKDNNDNTKTITTQTNILIKNIVNTYKIELGVRHPKEKYKTELDLLLTTAMTVGDSHITKKRRLVINDDNNNNKSKQPTYWYRQIKISNTYHGDQDKFLKDNPDIDVAIKQNFKNKANFKLVFDNNNTTSSIDYIVLRFFKKTDDDEPIYAYKILRPVVDKKIINDNINQNEEDDDDINEIINNNIDTTTSCDNSNSNNTITKCRNQQENELNIIKNKYNELENQIKQVPSSLIIVNNEYNELKDKYSKLETHVQFMTQTIKKHEVQIKQLIGNYSYNNKTHMSIDHKSSTTKSSSSVSSNNNLSNSLFESIQKQQKIQTVEEDSDTMNSYMNYVSKQTVNKKLL
jgi:hypothetical protein